MFQLVRSRALAVLAVCGASLGVGIGVQGLAAGATSNCRTVYARASSVVVHVCDRIVADFEFGTQGPIVPVWDVSRRPAKKGREVHLVGVRPLQR